MQAASNSQRGAVALRVEYCVCDLCDVDFPVPVVERGWLHARAKVGLWDAARLTAHVADGAWLSHYESDDRARPTERSSPPLALHAFAGFLPGDGFVELIVQRNAEIDDQPRFSLRVFAASSARADALLEQLGAEFLLQNAPEATQPRIALVNVSYGSLEVQRVALTDAQLVPRADVDLYYSDGMSGWVDAWLARLVARRYGLSILSGEPDTGKTTLLRSAAAWLAGTHAFYFMPASRFSCVDAGELVSFWVGENKTSRLRSVLVLEDAESILLRRDGDNRERVAALLNLTDGVMGDALGLQIVCTLNSDLDELDPALLRPGRLIGQRVFTRLDRDAAERLARHLGRRAPDGDSIALAELFNPPDPAVAITRPARRSLGFGMAPV